MTRNFPSRFPLDRCLLVAEVGLSHDGSLGLAHAFIDEIARNGADAVKFQTHIAEAESTPAEPFRVKFSRQDATRYRVPGSGSRSASRNGRDSPIMLVRKASSSSVRHSRERRSTCWSGSVWRCGRSRRAKSAISRSSMP